MRQAAAFPRRAHQGQQPAVKPDPSGIAPRQHQPRCAFCVSPFTGLLKVAAKITDNVARRRVHLSKPNIVFDIFPHRSAHFHVLTLYASVQRTSVQYETELPGLAPANYLLVVLMASVRGLPIPREKNEVDTRCF
jgi:hypothetical protein